VVRVVVGKPAPDAPGASTEPPGTPSGLCVFPAACLAPASHAMGTDGSAPAQWVGSDASTCVWEVVPTQGRQGQQGQWARGLWRLPLAPFRATGLGRLSALGVCVSGGLPSGLPTYLGELAAWVEEARPATTAGPSPVGTTEQAPAIVSTTAAATAATTAVAVYDLALRVTAAQSSASAGAGKGAQAGGSGGGEGGGEGRRVGVVASWACRPPGAALHCDVFVEGAFVGRSREGVLYFEWGPPPRAGQGHGVMALPGALAPPIVTVVPTTTQGAVAWDRGASRCFPPP
jgi:hypothetical protein